MTDYKVLTEFVIVLNRYSWLLYDVAQNPGLTDTEKLHCEELVEVFNDLFYKARDVAFTLYDAEDNDEAFTYFFRAID